MSHVAGRIGFIHDSNFQMMAAGELEKPPQEARLGDFGLVVEDKDGSVLVTLEEEMAIVRIRPGDDRIRLVSRLPHWAGLSSSPLDDHLLTRIQQIRRKRTRHTPIGALIPAQRGGYYVAGRYSVLHYHESSNNWKHLAGVERARPDAPADALNTALPIVRCLAETPAGLVVGTESGIFRLDEGRNNLARISAPPTANLDTPFSDFLDRGRRGLDLAGSPVENTVFAGVQSMTPNRDNGEILIAETDAVRVLAEKRVSTLMQRREGGEPFRVLVSAATAKDLASSSWRLTPKRFSIKGHKGSHDGFEIDPFLDRPEAARKALALSRKFLAIARRNERRPPACEVHLQTEYGEMRVIEVSPQGLGLEGRCYLAPGVAVEGTLKSTSPVTQALLAASHLETVACEVRWGTPTRDGCFAHGVKTVSLIACQRERLFEILTMPLAEPTKKADS